MATLTRRPKSVMLWNSCDNQFWEMGRPWLAWLELGITFPTESPLGNILRNCCLWSAPDGTTRTGTDRGSVCSWVCTKTCRGSVSAAEVFPPVKTTRAFGVEVVGMTSLWEVSRKGGPTILSAWSCACRLCAMSSCRRLCLSQGSSTAQCRLMISASKLWKKNFLASGSRGMGRGVSLVFFTGFLTPGIFPSAGRGVACADDLPSDGLKKASPSGDLSRGLSPDHTGEGGEGFGGEVRGRRSGSCVWLRCCSFSRLTNMANAGGRRRSNGRPAKRLVHRAVPFLLKYPLLKPGG